MVATECFAGPPVAQRCPRLHSPNSFPIRRCGPALIAGRGNGRLPPFPENQTHPGGPSSRRSSCLQASGNSSAQSRLRLRSPHRLRCQPPRRRSSLRFPLPRRPKPQALPVAGRRAPRASTALGWEERAAPSPCRLPMAAARKVHVPVWTLLVVAARGGSTPPPGEGPVGRPAERPARARAGRAQAEPPTSLLLEGHRLEVRLPGSPCSSPAPGCRYPPGNAGSSRSQSSAVRGPGPTVRR